MSTQRIIGKNALILMARGKTEIASQIFVYNQIREVRVNIDLLEVKVLMLGDDSYHRVFKVETSETLPIEKARTLVLSFYNNLLNASMKLSKEEIDSIKKQRESLQNEEAGVNE